MAYYVYILASRKDRAIYLGVTNDLIRRVYEHRIKAVRSFTSTYNITRLVWFEIHDDPIFCDFPRERIEEMEARVEGSVDRGKQSTME
jgi:hypothetical protein